MRAPVRRGLVPGMLVVGLSLCAQGLPPGNRNPFPGTGPVRLPKSTPTTTDPTPSSKKGKKKDKEEDKNVVKAAGTVRQIDDKQIRIEADDTRFLSAQISATTEWIGNGARITAAEVDIGSHVSLEARADDEGNLTALKVELVGATAMPSDKTATIAGVSKSSSDEDAPPTLRRGVPVASVKAAEAEPVEVAATMPGEKTATMAAPAKTSDEEDAAPTLRRGVPVASKKKTEPKLVATVGKLGSVPPATAQSEEHATVEIPATAPKRPEFIEKARAAAEEFAAHLPNFSCQQFTTRYDLKSKSEGWVPNDVVTAEVTYENGTERYGNVKIGNRKTNGGIMDMKGQRSNGEFASIQSALFSLGADGNFKFVRDGELARHPVKIYDFTVRRERSDWRVLLGGQSVVPGYSGRVWIDKQTARAMRIERQGDDIPEQFPIDRVEQTIEYAETMIGSRKVLLPASSENLSCQRGTPFCGRNVVEFRNYKEFRGEAKIEFEEPVK